MTTVEFPSGRAVGSRSGGRSKGLVHRPDELDFRLLILVTLGLVAFGLVMVFSATSAPAAIGGGDPGYYLRRQSIYALLGFSLMIAAWRADMRLVRRLAPALLVGSLALLVAVLVLGDPVNGARRWLTFGPAVLQPSELAKLAVALWAATYLARRRPPQRLRDLIRPLGLLVGGICALLMLEPDLGTTIALVVMVGGMLLVGGTPLRTLALAGSLTVALGLLAIWIEPYRRARILSFVDPWADAQNTGFQTVQAMIGLGSGGFFGVGLGEGVQKIFYLPEAHTDMIFAIIGEELGLVGATGVIVAYAAFAYAGFRIALRSSDPFCKRLAAGLTVLICGQAAINLAAVLGLAPMTGIPLPFVSYGGSSLVVALAAVGLLLNIAGNGGRATTSVPDRRRGDGGPRPAVPRRRRRPPRTGRPGHLRRLA